MRHLAVFLLSLTLICGAFASERQTDTRLNKTVTISERAIPVCELLEQLSEQTEVELTPDSHIRDRKVSIFITERPLSEVMERLRRHLRCAWSFRENQEGVRSYRLWQDKKSRDYEEWLRAKKRREYEDQIYQSIIERLSVYNDALSLIEDELVNLAVDDPNLVYDLQSPVLRKWLPELLELMLEESSKKLYSEGVTLPFEIFPLEAQQRLEEIKEDIGRIFLSFDSERDGLQIDMWFDNSRKFTYASPLIHDKDYIPSVAIQELTVNNVISEAQIAEFMEKRRAREENSMKEVDYNWDDIPKPVDPILLKTIELELESQNNRVDVVMEALAKASGLNLLADHFTCWDKKLPSWANKEIELYKAIHAINELYDLECEKVESYLLIEDKDWYSKILFEVPKWFIDKWAAIYEEKKSHDLYDYLEAAGELTFEQSRGRPLASLSGVLGPDLRINLFFSYKELKFYHSLNVNQRQMAWQDGVRYHSLNEIQKGLFLDVFTPQVQTARSFTKGLPTEENLMKYGIMSIGLPPEGVSKIVQRKGYNTWAFYFTAGPDEIDESFSLVSLSIPEKETKDD